MKQLISWVVRKLNIGDPFLKTPDLAYTEIRSFKGRITSVDVRINIEADAGVVFHLETGFFGDTVSPSLIAGQAVYITVSKMDRTYKWGETLTPSELDALNQISFLSDSPFQTGWVSRKVSSSDTTLFSVQINPTNHTPMVGPRVSPYRVGIYLRKSDDPSVTVDQGDWVKVTYSLSPPIDE